MRCISVLNILVWIVCICELTLFICAIWINILYFTLKISTMLKLCTGSLRIASVKSGGSAFFGIQRSRTVFFTASVIFEI